ncbi:hypothetical protein OG819_54535 [Streptomyces sp. NBC_01549]|uniref:hypothetical protein n=1 Tax=Streptomyces sp. NBC_01549 TaxID=2975874 RepID=UPI00224F1572|nr:hypothetical protein [Streptomyces sp. NBC_01549]MCX4598185.1 hypothetical protein [Streptomyces sp. NBC_01549]
MLDGLVGGGGAQLVETGALGGERGVGRLGARVSAVACCSRAAARSAAAARRAAARSAVSARRAVSLSAAVRAWTRR